MLPQGGSFVAPPFGATPHEMRVFQFFIVLPQGGSFVGSPFGAMGHESRVFQFFIVLPQGGSFVGSPFGAMGHFSSPVSGEAAKFATQQLTIIRDL